jgi:5-methylcytosine-specific restriction enzyme A
MAQAPLKKCCEPGCRQLIRGASRCEQHARTTRSRSKQSQESQALYDWRWRQASKRYRSEHPLCVACEQEGRTEPSTCVDHVVPHRGDLELFWNEENWSALCDQHHKSKTARGL